MMTAPTILEISVEIATPYTPVKYQYEHGVARYVDNIRQHGYIHRDPGISHRTAERGTRVIYPQKRKRHGSDIEIDDGITHHVLLHTSEHSPQDRAVSCYRYQCNSQ